MSARLERLRRHLAHQRLAGAVLRHLPNLHYLAGASPGPTRPGFLVVGPERAVAVLPGRADAAALSAGVERIGYDVPGATVDRVADVPRFADAALADALGRAGLPVGARLGVELDVVAASHLATLRRWGELAPIDGVVDAMRRVKDADEQARFRRAVALNDVGFEAARRAIGAGVSELAVQVAVVAAMQESAGVPVDILDDTDGLMSGPRCEGIVGLATPRRMERGDLVILDLNPWLDGYKGDTTRTYVVGEPSAEHRRMHDSVLRALDAMERLLRPGAPGGAVYAAFANVVADAGYGAGLKGHGGHGIGLEHLERPYLIAGDDMPLEAGMTIALEPGLYIPGLGGMRVEENYVITADGFERVSHFPRHLIRCG